MSETDPRSGWLEEMKRLLGLRPEKLELLWTGEHPNLVVFVTPGPALAGLSSLLQDEAFSAHLCAWPLPDELWLHARDPARGEERPLAVVRGGDLWLINGSGEPRDAPADDAEPPSFERWFERTFGVPLLAPQLAARMLPVAPDVWATRPLPDGERLDGFPHRLRLPGDEEQMLIGFAGYGCNSWACYFTIRRPGVRVYLRIPFGGAYMDAAVCGRNVAEEIRDVDDFVSRHAARLSRLRLSQNMGPMDAQLEYRDAPPLSGAEREALDRAAEHLLRMRRLYD